MTRKLIKNYSRRHFLQVSAVSALAINFLPRRVFGANERLSIAGIGVGGKGGGDISQSGKLGDVVALCDVDANSLNAKAKEFPKAKLFQDFREMLDTMGKEIDAATVSTADHTHAPAAIRAMRMGIHVYVQKPLTHTVWEARQMRLEAKKNNVCTQMGNQGTAENGLREAVELVRSGVLGAVRQAHVWTNRPVWPQAPGTIARPKDTPAIPAHVNWDAFLGPAPLRPYHGAYHPFKWRGWWDFGTGAMGDMACHTANMAYMALKLGQPNHVSAESGVINSETFPEWAHALLKFPARGDLPAVDFHWYEGKKDGKKVLPNADITALLPGKRGADGQVELASSGSLLVGDKGILYSPNDYGAAFVLLPEKDFSGLVKPKPTLPRNGKGDGGMKEEWVAAIKAGKPEMAMSNFDYAGNLTEAILLGNAAVRSGKSFKWDAVKLASPDVPSINQFITKEYRKGWEI